MKRAVIFLVMLMSLAACSSGGSSAGAEPQLANFSVMYRTWTLYNAYVFEWAPGPTETSSILVHSTDDFDSVNFCDCDVYGYGNESGGQLRVRSCAYRGNPSLTATKCVFALRVSNFNFTTANGVTNMCMPASDGSYTDCMDAMP